MRAVDRRRSHPQPAWEFAVNHDNDWQEERDNLVPYLDGLVNILKANPQVALIIFDLKDDDPTRAERLREIIRTHLTDHVPVNVLVSEASFDSREFFLPIKAGMRPAEAYAIDQDNDSRERDRASSGRRQYGPV